MPEVGRRGSVAGFRAALRFLRTDGGYHAAALTYYLIFALFPAGALIYALLGIFGAESAVDDVSEELDERGFDHEYVNGVRETITAAVTQRSDKALVAISVVAAIYVASQWLRGVRRGLDAVLERQHSPAGLSRDLRDACCCPRRPCCSSSRGAGSRPRRCDGWPRKTARAPACPRS